MRVIIAEKPSLARAIVDGLRLRAEKRDGYMQADGMCVTWVFGHILELEDASAYNPEWKRWTDKTLPIRVRDWQYRVTEPKQMGVIADLLKRASEVVHAGDPDREGQLLVDEVLHHLRWRSKTLRLLLNATDGASVRKAWESMRPNSEFQPLYRAGLCRQRADWLVGINGTRAATVLATTNGAMVPIGRVMTPTLALVVRRDRAIEGFVPQDFWRICIDVQTSTGQRARLVHDPVEHITDKALAAAIARRMDGAVVDLKVEREKKSERPPLPWHLGEYQRAMQKRFGLRLSQSLEILQSLYEKSLVSYPRTDCRYLPSEQKDQAIPIALALYQGSLQDWQVAAMERNKELLRPKDWIYDSAKVEEHHGIVPTGATPKPGSLSDNERRCFDAVVEHFCKTLLPSHEYLQTTISTTDDEGRVFRATHSESLNWDRSWRSLTPRKQEGEDREGGGQSLAGIEPGRAMVVGTDLAAGKTTPPEHYTEASLAQDMESVAKYATHEKIKARLKETSGIGTAATRSAIIDKLKRYGMIEEFKKSSKGKSQAMLRSTPFGREVVDAVPASLSDPALTATWEEALNMIAKGQYSDTDFMDKIDDYVERIVVALRALAQDKKIRSTPPESRQPHSQARSRSTRRAA